MASTTAYVPVFEEYPMPIGAITLDAGALFFRASSRWLSGIPSAGPLYVGSHATASFYAANDRGRALEAYRTTRPVRLLDVRLFGMLVPEILRLRAMPTPPAEARWMRAMALCYGGCSFAAQLKLLEDFAAEAGRPAGDLDPYRRMVAYRDAAAATPDLVELQGVRVGLTDLDYEVMAIVRNLFANVDGLIAPRLSTPAHVQNAENRMLEEVVFFYPQVALQAVPYAYVAGREMPTRSVRDFFPENSHPLFTDPSRAYIAVRRAGAPRVAEAAEPEAERGGGTVIIGAPTVRPSAPPRQQATIKIGDVGDGFVVLGAEPPPTPTAAGKAEVRARSAFERRFARSRRLQAAYERGGDEGWAFHRRIRADARVPHLLRQFMCPTDLAFCGEPRGPSAPSRPPTVPMAAPAAGGGHGGRGGGI